LSSDDLFGRFGGDEFLILLPQTKAQEALHLAGRIHACIGALQLESGKSSLTLTISIGIAQTIHTNAPEVGVSDTLKNLLLRADQALYTAKQAGKNRTIVFDADKTLAG
jgi:diguanylate cyclase (GGDEF)-like protein